MHGIKAGVIFCVDPSIFSAIHLDRYFYIPWSNILLSYVNLKGTRYLEAGQGWGLRDFPTFDRTIYFFIVIYPLHVTSS